MISRQNGETENVVCACIIIIIIIISSMLLVDLGAAAEAAKAEP